VTSSSLVRRLIVVIVCLLGAKLGRGIRIGAAAGASSTTAQDDEQERKHAVLYCRQPFFLDVSLGVVETAAQWAPGSGRRTHWSPRP